MTSIPVLAVFVVFSDRIFDIMVAPEYRIGVEIVPYIAISAFLVGVIHKFQLGILVREETNKIMYIVLVSGVSNVVCNLLLLPRFGIMGAAYGTTLSLDIGNFRVKPYRYKRICCDSEELITYPGKARKCAFAIAQKTRNRSLTPAGP